MLSLCVCVCIWACKCTQCPQVHSLQSCQMMPGPATSITCDPCNSCFVLGTPFPSDILPLELPQMTDTTLLSVSPHYPSSLWPPQHLCLSALLPSHSSKGAETWACGELIAGATESRVKWYQKTESEEKTEREGGEAVVGAGQVWNWSCVSARRGSSGVKLHQRKLEEEEEETAGVFEWSILLSVLFSFSCCLSVAWLTGACSFLLTHCSEPAALDPRFQVNEPRRPRPYVWELDYDVSVMPWGRNLHSVWVSVPVWPCHDHQVSKDSKCPSLNCLPLGVSVHVCTVWGLCGSV